MEGGKQKRDLPTITYTAGTRSFERLFKETSLEEIRDVVRRKLQLPPNSTVKLKQLRGLKQAIDLDDDDDFDAFCARARLMVPIDVAVDVSTPATEKVTSSAGAVDAVGTSKVNVTKTKRKTTDDQPSEDVGTTVATEPKLKKRKKDSEEPTPVASSSKRSAKSKVSTATKTTDPDGQPPTKKPKTANADVASTRAVTKSTEKPPADSIDEQPPKKKARTVKVVAKPTEKIPADTTDEQPPKKKPKTTKADTSKDITPTEVVKPTEKPSTDLIDVQPPKKKPKTTKADTSKDATKHTEKLPKKATKAVNAKEPSELSLTDNDAVSALPGPVEPSGKASGVKKKATRKSSSPQLTGVERPADHTDKGPTISKKTKSKETEVRPRKLSVPISRPVDPNYKKEKAATLKEKTKESKPSKAKAPNADAFRPLDAADVRDIVNRIATAISSMEPEEAEASTKDKTKKIAAKRKLVDASQPSASSAPSVIKPTKGGVSSSPLCHVCSGSFHLLYRCPTVLAGDQAIQNRLEELKKAGTSEHQVAIKDLESLLKSSSVAASSASDAARKDLETDNEPEREATKAAKKSSRSQPSWTPLMPNNSLLSEVAIESRDEGSSSEEEDEFDHQPVQEEHDVEVAQPSFDDVDLDAIIRGPKPIKLHNLISAMESKEDGSDTEDEDVDMGTLEVEDDGAEERKYRRLSQRLAESSEEQEDDEDGGGGDDNEQKSMLPPKQNISGLSSGGPKLFVKPNDVISKAKDPAGNRTEIVPSSDTDDTRVSITGAPDSNKNLGEDPGEAAEAPDVDKLSDTPPAGDILLLHNKPETNNDPIEPADDLVVTLDGVFDTDPIEPTTPPSLKATVPLSPLIHSTPKSGVVKRMKNRHGEHPSPSQAPVRADEPEVNNRLTRRKTKVATRTSSDRPSIRRDTRAARADLLRISSQPVGRVGVSATLSGHAATPSHSQPLPEASMSLAKWDVIHEHSPSIMTDEIDLSSPPLEEPGDEPAGRAADHSDGERSDDDSAAKSGEPLFTLTASQVPFPYSQYNEPIQRRVEVASDSSDVESETNDGDEKKKIAAKPRGSIAAYRKLSDIAANQSALFSQNAVILPGSSSITGRRVWQVDDEDDETSSSDSDDESQSHIPEANKAGKLRFKKPKGLLAALDRH